MRNESWSVGIGVAVVFGKLLLFVRLDILFSDDALDAAGVHRLDLLTLHVFVEDQLELYFLGQLVQLELAIVTQVWRREDWVQNDSTEQADES